MTTPTKPILIAGLLGGLLGGVVSFAAMRFIKPAGATADAPAVVPVPAEAKQVAEGFIAKLKAGKYDEFLTDVKTAMVFYSENDSRAFQKTFEDSRTVHRGVYGTPTGEFDLVHATALTPDVVRFTYVEKFPRGAVAWCLVLYHNAERWQLNEVVWNKNLSTVFPDKP